LKKVLVSREERQRADYQQRLSSGPLKTRLQELAGVRTEEGYMAEVKAEGRDAFLFVENHCPICAAATACKGLCATELDLFRAVLGPGVSVERTEHIVSGDRRCTYRIQKAEAALPAAVERKEAGVVLLTHGYGCLLPDPQRA
jgi:predicted ArsR family transcriptional regulator